MAGFVNYQLQPEGAAPDSVLSLHPAVRPRILSGGWAGVVVEPCAEAFRLYRVGMAGAILGLVYRSFQAHSAR